jgi:hypothetical protein
MDNIKNYTFIIFIRFVILSKKVKFQNDLSILFNFIIVLTIAMHQKNIFNVYFYILSLSLSCFSSPSHSVYLKAIKI